MTEHNDHPSGYEKRDVNVKALTIVAIVTVLVVVAMVVFVYNFFSEKRDEIVFEQQLLPKSQELLDLHAHEDSVLTNYRVLDSANGTYSIPIDSAIEILLRESSGTGS